MEIIIFVRQKIDWLQMTKNLFYSQGEDSPVKKILDSKIDLLNVWNKLFPINFFNFRSKVKTIAELQNAKIECKIIRGKEELIKELSEDADAYILPVDDDDFFSPEINILKDSKQNIIIWGENHLIGSSIKRNNSGVGTNCYAIKKSHIKKIFSQNQQYDVLLRHGVISRMFCRGRWQQPDCKVTKLFGEPQIIDKMLSISNRHIGTITFLQYLIYRNYPEFPSQIELSKNIANRLLKYVNNSNLEFAPKWCIESVNANVSLHMSLFNVRNHIKFA